MKYSNIGGQAVMEGVMMRNAEKWAVAVRTADNQITVKTGVYNGVIPWKGIGRIPILRGVCSFIDSLYLGMKTLMFSADLFAEESEKELEERLRDEAKKARKKADRLRSSGKDEQADKLIEETEKKAEAERRKLKEREESGNGKSSDSDNSALLTLTLIFSLAVSIALFMMLPYFLSRALRMVTSSESLISVCEAILRMLIFFGYLLLISRMKDIQRTFMYHGAEHKCINCIEHGMELNVENVRKSSRQHKRCGTSFLLIVMIVSVIFFFFIRTSNPVSRIVIRILLIPVIAGVSFEFIRLAGKYDNKCVNILSKPGLLLQKLTTREPDDDQIRVGMASVEAVFNWKKYLNENFGTEYEITQADEPHESDDIYTIKNENV